MSRKIKVTIKKEDIFDVQSLIDEIKEDPQDAYALCEVHGIEGFSYDAFADFDCLTQEAKDRLIIDLATSKAEADAKTAKEALKYLKTGQSTIDMIWGEYKKSVPDEFKLGGGRAHGTEKYFLKKAEFEKQRR